MHSQESPEKSPVAYFRFVFAKHACSLPYYRKYTGQHFKGISED